MELVIDELTRPDLDDPLVLVKNFRDQDGELSTEIFFVQKISLNLNKTRQYLRILCNQNLSIFRSTEIQKNIILFPSKAFN